MSLVLISTAAISIGWLLWMVWSKISPAKSLPGIPLVEFEGDNSRQRYTSDAASLLLKGYDTYTRNGEPFCIRDFLNESNPRVYLPVKYLEEVRNAPQEKLSLPGILHYTSTIGKVGGGPRITEEIQTSARVDLNRALNKLIEPMEIRCFQTAEKEMPACPDWTSVVLYPKILELFSQMSARVMVGPELCEAWSIIAKKYIACSLAAQTAIRKKYYTVLYWTAYYLNPELARVDEVRHEAAELVRPVLEARQAAYAALGEKAEKHDDFIQWIMDNYRANGKTVTPIETVQNIFIVMFASMHGTSFIALQSLFSLIGTPDALVEVRKEIERVSMEELQESSWTRHALGELRLMDSFMKETLRLKPFQEGTVQRYTMTPYTFKDGLYVPARTVVSFPNLRYNMDTMSPAGPDADAFDGKRWLRRRAGFETSKFQFASTAEDAFDWGGGPHACPGRFMADVTIKLILICLVTKYDMKLPEGGQERPSESRRFMDRSPDTSTPVMIRDIQK
ncbi:cytochrome P450 [Xylaria sp. FL1777]|nr:cytochrome P450 [Xylaria sp. FL1777]